MKALLFCFVGLPILGAALVFGSGCFESWQAKRDWERYKAGLEARGEHFSISDFIPPPVPDEQNLALSPLFKPLLQDHVNPKTGEATIADPDAPLAKVTLKNASAAPYPRSANWETGRFRMLEGWEPYYRDALPAAVSPKSPAEYILAVLGRYDPVLAELRAEMQARPLCRFPLHYEKAMGTDLPHLSVLKNVVSVLSLRAICELRLARNEEAFNDITLAYRIMGTFRDEPMVVDGLFRITLIAIMQQPVWEGIASHSWNPEQLSALEKEFQSWDLAVDFNRCMRLERCECNWACEQLRGDPKLLLHMSSSSPPGYVDLIYGNFLLRPWWSAVAYRNEIWVDTIFQDEFLVIVDEKARTFGAQRARIAAAAVESTRATPYTFFGKIVMPVYAGVADKFARAQAWLNEDIIACEIERYRLVNGRLPATLDDLHMASLPRDVIDGKPFHYRVAGPDNYFLYSVGWNETDDGGTVKVNEEGFTTGVTDKQGDWVWSLKPL